MRKVDVRFSAYANGDSCAIEVIVTGLSRDEVDEIASAIVGPVREAVVNATTNGGKNPFRITEQLNGLRSGNHG
jgi:hypothetical protein